MIRYVIGGLLALVAVPVAQEVRRIWKPKEIEEGDVRKAESDKSAMRASGRLREVSPRQTPEWVKRLRKSWMGMGKLGEIKRRQT